MLERTRGVRKDGTPHKKLGKKHSVTYDTDQLARNTFLCLLRDFRSVHGNAFMEGIDNSLLGSIGEFRALNPRCDSSDTPSLFKAKAQIAAYLKKYRFAVDVHNDKDLERITLEEYFSAQEVISVAPRRFMATSAVLQKARTIARQILGEYPEERVIHAAKFGRKSSIGCPLSLAHIDFKLSNVRAFTGSKSSSKWFYENFVLKDKILRDCLKRLPADVVGGVSKNLEVESLVLKNVPKSWKTLRTITPLTLLGLFLSHGIGGVVTEQLAAAGLDIRHLQGKHRKLVKKFSITRSHATADLSRASDSITSELLNMVLPRAWYVSLKRILTHQLIVEKDGGEMSAYTASVLPMGNGATFPLETLIFYCIIKAIGALTGVTGIYSVYGDDLIYPSQLHKYVTTLFPSFGFSLNLDKTFVTSNFRESCGADYYHGVDVRPFTFPGEHQELSRSKYLVLLYKVYNGLCLRWHPLEIRSTLYFLLKEMALTGYQIMRVPPSYPATAGIHVQSPGDLPLDCENLDYSPIYSTWGTSDRCTMQCNGSRWYKFSYMTERSENRFVEFTEPYYWLALQGLDDTVDRYAFWHEVKPRIAQEPQLRWSKTTRYRSFWKGKRKISKRIVRWQASVAEKQLTRIIECLASITDWV